MNREEARKLADQAVHELSEQLAQGKSKRLGDYLRTMSRFWSYSLGNMTLIAVQRPDATHVAGYRTWQALGRQVKKGEHGIAIFSPIVRRSRLNNRKKIEPVQSQIIETESPASPGEERVAGFRRVYVFDVAQTEGRDLPEFACPQGDPREHLARLQELIAAEGIALEYHRNLDGADGASIDGRILIRTGLTPAEEFSVLAHEAAHHRLHLRGDRAENHTVRETEAEAVAAVVCGAIGIDSCHSSADYIHLHQGDKQLFLKSLERIRRCAFEIIESIAGDGPAIGPASAGKSASPYPSPFKSPGAETEVFMKRNPNIDNGPSPRGAVVALRMWRAATEGVQIDELCLQETLDTVDWCVARDVAAGFIPLEEIVDNVLQVLSGKHDPEPLRLYAEDTLREAIQYHLNVQSGWSAVTDCDRLDSACIKLEEAGIICRQDFTCCGRCGVQDIRQEMARQRQAGREFHGYMFHCYQDTQYALQGEGLCLSYGSVLQNNKADVGVGWEIVAALRAQGLEVNWDGNLRHRIHVAMDWQRRLLPATLPQGQGS